jgi:hypothetical protein
MRTFHGTAVVLEVAEGSAKLSEVRGAAVVVPAVVLVVVDDCVSAADVSSPTGMPRSCETAVAAAGVMVPATAEVAVDGVAVAATVPILGVVAAADDVPVEADKIGARFGCGNCGRSCCAGGCCCGCSVTLFDGAADPFPEDPSSPPPPVPNFRFFLPLPDPAPVPTPPPPPLPAPPEAECASSNCKFRRPVT